MSKQVMLDDRTYDKIKRMAEQLGCSMSAVVRQSINDNTSIYKEIEVKLDEIKYLYLKDINNEALNFVINNDEFYILLIKMIDINRNKIKRLEELF